MNNTLDFETAIKILNSDIFDSYSLVGAIEFVAEAFNVSIDGVLEKLDYDEEDYE